MDRKPDRGPYRQGDNGDGDHEDSQGSNQWAGGRTSGWDRAVIVKFGDMTAIQNPQHSFLNVKAHRTGSGSSFNAYF